MEQVWSWLTALPSSDNWPDTNSPRSFLLAGAADKSIVLKAERTARSNTEALATFSLCLHGFQPARTLWVSDPCPLSSPVPPLLCQLVREVIARAPGFSGGTSTAELAPEAVCAALGVEEEAPAFLSLALLCRLFWLCAFDAPADAGFLFFEALDVALDSALSCGQAARGFLVAAGADMEQRFARSVGYMLAKWHVIRELQAAPQRTVVRDSGYGLSYATEAHGLWVVKGFVPVAAMARVGAAGGGAQVLDAKEAVLRYALAHQQLEAVVQLEYFVSARDPRFIRVGVRVDNIRLQVVSLGFGANGDNGDGVEETTGTVAAERHFPSRVRVLVGPGVGSAYATGPSLGRSTANPETEVEETRTVKGSFSNSKSNKVKATARSSARSRARRWRWEQEVEGSAGVFDGVLCDAATGTEVEWRRPMRGGTRRRCGGLGRALVVAGDELAEGASWRVGRGMEGRVVRWRIGGKVWLTYVPNVSKSGHFETRCVEWTEEVDLPLVATCQ